MPLHQALKFINEKVSSFVGEGVQTLLKVRSKDNDSDNGVYVSLLYLDEEKTMKNNSYMIVSSQKRIEYDGEKKKRPNTYRKTNPEIYLNLYIMITSVHSSYEESLRQISAITMGFWRQNVFTKENGIGKEYDKLEKLILDINTLTFEQNNSLWQTIGGSMYPFLIYKVKMIAFSEESMGEEIQSIKEIQTKTEYMDPEDLKKSKESSKDKK